jgi:hypothetical protein
MTKHMGSGGQLSRPSSKRRPLLVLVLAGSVPLSGTLGCVGSVGDADSQPGAPTPGDTSGTAPVAGTPTGGSAALPSDPGALGGCQEMAPLVTAARRLTREQYVNTVRDLLGDGSAAVGSQLPKDDVGDSLFADPSTLLVSPDWASNAMDAAEAAAKVLVAKLPALMPCDAAAGEQACVDKFINGFGKRAFRRPLEAVEIEALGKVYAVGAKNGGYPHGIEVVTRALLQSPSFLYRLELGQKTGSSGASVHLGPYEVASRLSYLLWNTMPDAALMDAADSGKLASAEDIAGQARRMLADPRAHRTLGEFHSRWLGVDGLGDVAKDPMRYPQFDDKLMASMRTEMQMFVEDVLFGDKSDGRLESLFNARFTYVDALVAPLYGATAPAGGGFGRVDLDPAHRGGLLTNVGIIAAHTYADESGPIHRGKFIRENFLCTTPPDPPADLMVEPPVPKPGVSTRQRLMDHSAMPACHVCHAMMDPIGFGFESYDGIGRYRATDASGKAIDDSGTLDMLRDGSSFAFHGPVELGQKLAASTQVRECVVTNVLKFAQGTEAAADSCVQQKLRTAFEASNHDLRELFIAITRTEGFRFRRAIEGEVLP